MMNKLITFLLLQFFIANAYAQNISFTDMALKDFLINEKCIDLNNDSVMDIDADFNNDNEIQTSEADSILSLHIGYHNDNYFIHSVQDLSQFHNLKSLTLTHNDSLREISNLGLDSLKTFIVDAEFSLRSVDVSDLTHLTDLRIEGCDTLDYLNIQNGSVADYFSLFYTEHIHYACVDNIAAEYDEVAWRMITGVPSINCETAITKPHVNNEDLSLFPNPTSGIIIINSSISIENVLVFNALGELMNEIKLVNHQLNITQLNKGIYFIGLQTKEGIEYRKILKQ